MYTKELVRGHNLPQILHGKLTIKDATTTADICAVNPEIVQRTVLVELCFSGSSQRLHPVHSVLESYHPFPESRQRARQVCWAHPTSHNLEAWCKDVNFLLAFQNLQLQRCSRSFFLSRGMSRCKEYLKGFLAQVEAKAGQEKEQLAEEFQVSKNYFSGKEDWGLGEALK